MPADQLQLILPFESLGQVGAAALFKEPRVPGAEKVEAQLFQRTFQKQGGAWGNQDAPDDFPFRLGVEIGIRPDFAKNLP